MNRYLATTLIAGAATFGPTSTVVAQNTFYARGDLVLFFQKQGSTNTVYANLGKAATVFRGDAAGPDAPNKVEFLDISTTLVSAFGGTWATDPNIYAGLAGVLSNNNTNGVSNPDGDPFRTIYISRARDSAGAPGTAGSSAWDLLSAGDTNMSNASTGIQTQNDAFEINYNAQHVVSPTSISIIEDQNPLISAGVPPVTIQDPAMNGALEGGIQQRGSASILGSFGAAGNVEFALDLYRVLARNNVAGQVAGPLRVGSFEGTVTVGTNGRVSFLASDFGTWLTNYTGLDTPAKRLPGADPDSDGLENMLEFVLNSNPASGSGNSVPIMDASSSNFVFSFTRRDDSENQVSLMFEYGSDLGNWTPVPIGPTGSVSGMAIVTVMENGAADDSISVSVPKSAVPGGKLFGRLNASGF